MALECAHCGTRCDDGVTRCPKCLRSTHLVSVEAPASKRPPPLRALALVAAVTVAVGAGTFAYLRARPPSTETPPVPETVAPSAANPLSIDTPELRAVAERLRAERDPVARARAVATEVQRRRVAAVASDDDPPPPPRAPDLLWRVLPSPNAHVTELDLARLVAALLRAAGDASASVAERTAPARSDEPLEASGVLGSFVVASGEHVIEVTQGTLVGSASVRHAALSPSALAGAISSQAALELATSGAAPDRALQYANAAVDAWTDSPVPLAARAKVWLLAGASSGLPLAESDLRSAIALRDDAALHMLLARTLLLQGNLAGAAFATLRASTMAPAWGTPAVALLAMRPVTEQLDAGAPDACALLRSGRAPWTDDAYALCDPGVAAGVRAGSARRLFDASHDPLRVAFSASALGPDIGASLRSKIPAPERREAASWLSLLGRPELAAAVMGISLDAGN